MPASRARLTWALAGLVLAAGGVGAATSAGLGTADAVLDLVTGLAWIAAGTAIGATRTGALALLTGATWFAGDLAPDLVFLHRGPLVHLLLTAPRGRLRAPAARVVIGLAYVDGLFPGLARADWPTIVLAAAVAGTGVTRYALATGVERRGRLAPSSGAVAIALVLAAAAVLRLADAGGAAATLRIYDFTLALTAVALAADLLLGRWVRGAVTGLVVDLGGDHQLQALRTALARTLGDPELTIAYRLGNAWVDDAGVPAEIADAQTVVEEDGVPIAALSHDPTALRDPELARAVAAGVRLAVANARLEADMATRVRDVEASRRRLAEAADAERRRFGEALRRGPERRLQQVAARVAMLPGAEALREELAGCRADLERFAQGVHPRALTEHGLRPALLELARRAPGAVTVDAPSARFGAEREAAVYFVCAEALANVAKYAPGAAARIAVSAADGRLRLVVSDEGPGGADPARGSGLRGLVDRLDVVGGTLRVSSPPGAGTTLAAEVPA